MRLILIIISRLPPVNVLLGAGFALASYFVANVWKTEIENEIKRYAAISERAATVEAQLGTRPMFQASSRFWADSIGLLKLQIAAISRERAATIAAAASKPADRPAGTAYVDPVSRAFNGRSVFADHRYMSWEPNIYEEIATTNQLYRVTQFFQSLPPELKALPERTNNIKSFDIEATSAVTMAECLASHEPEEANYYHENVLPPSKESAGQIGAAVDNLVSRLNAGEMIAMRIRLKNPPPDFNLDAVVQSRFHETSLACIKHGRDGVQTYLTGLLWDLRAGIADRIVAPKEETKHKVERVEIFLYAIGAVVALFGHAPPAGGSTTQGAQAASARRSTVGQDDAEEGKPPPDQPGSGKADSVNA